MSTVIDIKDKIDTVLKIVCETSNDNDIIKTVNIMRVQILQYCICDSELYNNKNYELITMLYKFLKFRKRWERGFRLDYADCLYYSKYSCRDINGIIIVINQFFIELDNIVKELEDIIGINYDKSIYNHELPNYCFHSKSISINK